MQTPRYTAVVGPLPSTVPFVGPETQERARGRAFRARIEVADPLPRPRRLPPLPADVSVDEVPLPTAASLGLGDEPLVIRGGEAAGRARLAAFVDDGLARYPTARDQLADVGGTSHLSADLKFGTLSARTAWTTPQRRRANSLPRFMTRRVSGRSPTPQRRSTTNIARERARRCGSGCSALHSHMPSDAPHFAR